MNEQPRPSAHEQMVEGCARAAEATDDELRVTAASALDNPGTTVRGPQQVQLTVQPAKTDAERSACGIHISVIRAAEWRARNT